MDLAESAAYLRHHLALAGREEPRIAAFRRVIAAARFPSPANPSWPSGGKPRSTPFDTGGLPSTG
jgi:hypothetical protein